MGSQEKQISEASVINRKNLYKLLFILREVYPSGYLYDNLKKRAGIEIMPRIQLKELIDERLLKLYDVSEQYKKSFSAHGKMFPQYMITKEGMNFLNNIEVFNLNKRVKQLTVILVIFGVITILLMMIQVFFQISLIP
ncbi:hypothetical protein HYX13_00810 [Candidatus Woesearchaeota archaeon]|nr:hypothetical protein [Candidatus Woesearchaeota archaeon]